MSLVRTRGISTRRPVRQPQFWYLMKASVNITFNIFPIKCMPASADMPLRARLPTSLRELQLRSRSVGEAGEMSSRPHGRAVSQD